MDYEKTTIYNAFNAPVFRIEKTISTMSDARHLAALNEGDGTVVYANHQTGGRGRIEGRQWQSIPEESLLCTILLRRPVLPALTLRVGLAVALTFDSYLRQGAQTSIKWPNDVLYDGKKLSGILCENDGNILYIGTGFNIAQKQFSAELQNKATSLALIPGAENSVPSIDQVLTRYLKNLKYALEEPKWKKKITAKLFRRAEKIRFLSGDPNKKEFIDGCIEGIGDSGELLFRRENDNSIVCLYSGEIPYV